MADVLLISLPKLQEQRRSWFCGLRPGPWLFVCCVTWEESHSLSEP